MTSLARGASRRSDSELRLWLRGSPDLDALRREFPVVWAELQAEVARRAGAEQDSEAVAAYLRRVACPPRRMAGRQAPRQLALAELVRQAMVLEMLRTTALARASGVDGVIRLNRWNAWWAQPLFFRVGLQRKAVSLLRFRLTWPLLTQRRRLMPLLMSRGVYCFFTTGFVRRLRNEIGGRDCIEIAAGDGTLSRLLIERGTRVRATDNAEWETYIDYPAAVERLSASAALRKYAPEVVLCCWPPPDNDFEKVVLRTPSVQTYIVVLPGHDSEAGDWKAYAGSGFDVRTDRALSRGVLPGKGNRVLIFTRRDDNSV